MCVTCLAFSAMTLFSPVTEAPQPANVAPASVPSTQVRQVKSMSVAEETRIVLTEMLKRMPNSPETRVLREEFKSLQAKLVGVKDDDKADAIIDDGVNSLSKRVMAAPNSDQLIEVLFELREAKNNQQAANILKLNMVSGRLSSAPLPKGQSGNGGWLS